MGFLWLEVLSYFDFSEISISVVAATIAGATTMPIKARAIKRSCIVFLSSQDFLQLGAHMDDRRD
jgi:hypothetical protein